MPRIQIVARMSCCAHARELQSELRGGSITVLQRLGLWLHTRLCPPCAHTGKMLDRTLELLRDLGERDCGK